MTQSQELRRHLVNEHPDIDDSVRYTLTRGLASFDFMHSVHVEQHDHRGSVYHTSHKGIVVESRETRGLWYVVIECKSKRHAEEVAQHVQHVRPGDVSEQLISVRVEPAPPELTHNDARWWERFVGRSVIFTYMHGEQVGGVVSSVNDVNVFVDFGAAAGAQACDPSMLTLQGREQ